MQTPDKIKVPFASGTGALKSTIPDAGTTTDETASMAMGFPPRTMSTDTDKIAPTGQDFNGILNKITTGLQYLQAGACYKFDSAFATAIGGYPIGAMVLSNDGMFRYVNTVANNTSNPDSGGIGWKRHDIASNGILYTVATGTANDIYLEYDDIEELEDGLIIGFRAKSSNTGDVTITINNDIEKTLLKGAENSLSVGDISGAGYMVLAQYSLSADAFIMLNPAKRLTDAVSSRQILEVFYTFRTDASPINGAYDCNGAEYHNYDFTGENNPYDMLVAGKAKTCTYTEYDEEVASKGSCSKFALNITAMTFKVPTLTNILQPTVLASAIGEICDAGLPNIKGSAGVIKGISSKNESGALYFSSIVDGNGYTGSQPDGNKYIAIDASRSSSLYKDNFNTVQPQTIYARAMVQLATAGQEISIEQYEQQLSDYARTNTINGRLIGEIIQSALPLTDAGVHLLDGSQIQKSGIYAQFCTYVAGLQEDYPDLFCTEAEFADSVATYGSCGKFVNGASYIRLPKVSDILQGTTDLSAVGDLVEAGLPNITGYARLFGVDAGNGGYSGALSLNKTFSNSYASHNSGTKQIPQVDFDASLSSPYYKDSVTKPTPQTIKSLLYICVATSVKTPVEVEIDDIITDNNNKADKDFSNVTKPYITEIYSDAEGNWYSIRSDGWVEQGGFIKGSGDSTGVTVTMPIELKDFDGATDNEKGYHIFTSARHSDTNIGANLTVAQPRFSNRTSTSFVVVVAYVGSSSFGLSVNNFSWKTCGYKA